jgi:hypothetical protein
MDLISAFESEGDISPYFFTSGGSSHFWATWSMDGSNTVECHILKMVSRLKCFQR